LKPRLTCQAGHSNATPSSFSGAESLMSSQPVLLRVLRSPLSSWSSMLRLSSYGISARCQRGAKGEMTSPNLDPMVLHAAFPFDSPEEGPKSCSTKIHGRSTLNTAFTPFTDPGIIDTKAERMPRCLSPSEESKPVKGTPYLGVVFVGYYHRTCWFQSLSPRRQ
jgi:hypothetical protein